MASAPKERVSSTDQDTDTKKHVDIPTDGLIDQSQIQDEHVEVVSAAGFDDYAKELAFMHELVEVEVLDSTSENFEPIVEVYCNGVAQRFARGVPQKVKRMFVQILATSKPETMRTETRVHGDQVVNRVTKHAALRYPFTVTEDSKRGREWLRKVLAQNG